MSTLSLVVFARFVWSDARRCKFRIQGGDFSEYYLQRAGCAILILVTAKGDGTGGKVYSS